MSVPAYIAGDKTGPKMPRLGEKERDSVGIKFSGSVMRGEKTVEQGLREAAVRASMRVDKRGVVKEEVEGWTEDVRDQWGRSKRKLGY
jgi:hypothetical protein